MKLIYEAVKKFFLKYPAVLAAYFIYSYYFISTMDFYIKFKRKHFSASEALQHFDTLFWMWILAYAMIRVIGLREKLHFKEKEITSHENSLKLQETQITTLHEVIGTLKHEINNPLAIILGYVQLMKKKNLDEDMMKKLNEIETASLRINSALSELAEMKTYQTTSAPVGKMVERAEHTPDTLSEPPAQ